MKKRQVYLDNAATTPIDKRVLAVMKPFLTDDFGNPSSFHTPGKVAGDALDGARKQVADVIGARSDEIIFTSGGTESDNLAILGFARKNQNQGKHIISTKVEHPAVLESLEQLEKEGFEVTLLIVDEFGRVSSDDVVTAIRPDTILISIIYANNEIGTVNPISEIGKQIQKNRTGNFPAFHTDACQAAGALELNQEKLHVDLMTVNASKIYGPKGNGALFVKRGLKLQPLQFGGHQERRVRPGTENVAGIIGFTEALRIADQQKDEESKRLIKLRDYFICEVQKLIPKTRLNGHPTERLPNNINISFMDIEGEALTLYLDAKGIYVSTGSACTSASLDPSHVIVGLSLPYEVAHGSIRFSLGRSTTKKDLDYVLEFLPELVEKLRKISPVSVDAKYFK
ncbi:cysteine desulfurase NifS [Candidatus Uhrbacteria bacterium CG_4_9_14_0_2_um_filter_41_50]|uniref:Cysteine desulfurase NifS n=1 Tax=Candidatus Uhrbacteria bacterium CG_4_9_14_0_2_um_filter_41_50 TaxID=1975031 RepID=A0A2M8EP83_9BACT|nr:MAG: cysteine desulfurase NifS [Candidatus Uhrbacteria bacterium CG_4_10_14_3_um_filter_41_21]PIZ55440.1 MAG: cysteine desulfurase NifS [Candidatus Uhrbacteria bacterium CG_4_10_14_0_2_um_filter_41_21]PJB84621.1 MAG: cysteine desulfurase NifS [Candidatus Uhrbacteria bacterium CG_4_9_14_0_8_um_filter_41_16]PJC24550.1 MAG: cysteine desulfurase NifS [Candidatus Uhrbacteria bacterium CG_4_9_14_0_2_um_filter_41_50]PJE74756.1 MAG: cysteine desulfurase NifS [Candidatus Uhrbacteria bacterium CG10_bi